MKEWMNESLVGWMDGWMGDDTASDVSQLWACDLCSQCMSL